MSDDDDAGDDESDCVSDGDGNGRVNESGRVSENANENETDDAVDGDDDVAYGSRRGLDVRGRTTLDLGLERAGGICPDQRDRRDTDSGQSVGPSDRRTGCPRTKQKSGSRRQTASIVAVGADGHQLRRMTFERHDCRSEGGQSGHPHV